MRKTDLQTFKIARFALNATYEDIGRENTDQLKRHLLDSFGSFIFSSTQPSVQKLVRQIAQLGEGGKCIVPLASPIAYDRAAQLYTSLIRYLDFMDNFLGKEATCHPSDNIGSLLAAAQYRPTTGKDFLTAMAVAYQVECRLVQEIPVMKEGIDHTLLLGFSIITGIARLLGLTEQQTAHALGITGTSISPMVTSRAAYTFEWKGFASSLDAKECMGIAFLALNNMTGPVALFEGPKGFAEVFGMKLDYDWDRENFELIKKCILKEYNAEVHSQSALEAVAELRNKHAIKIEDIERVDITTFFTAYHIIGSGAYGDRQKVFTKEQADHSLFYVAAVLLIDGDLYPAQLTQERINRPDVQELLKKVHVRTCWPIHKPVVVMGILDKYTEQYPDKMMAKVEIKLKSGRTLTVEKPDYHGFHTRPLDWNDVIQKFRRLTSGIISEDISKRIITTVQNLDQVTDISELIKLLAINRKAA